jgi:hypothetical protein
MIRSITVPPTITGAAPPRLRLEHAPVAQVGMRPIQEAAGLAQPLTGWLQKATLATSPLVSRTLRRFLNTRRAGSKLVLSGDPERTRGRKYHPSCSNTFDIAAQ